MMTTTRNGPEMDSLNESNKQLFVLVTRHQWLVAIVSSLFTATVIMLVIVVLYSQRNVELQSMRNAIEANKCRCPDGANNVVNRQDVFVGDRKMDLVREVLINQGHIKPELVSYGHVR